MYYINKTYTNTLEVKQSKFITYLIPYAEYKNTLADLKIKHPKARHFVVASRYLNEFNQTIEAANDDGEPKGTSGKPSLMVLQGANMINTAVVIVRYFGGTKLGTGGLVRAYSDAVNEVINLSELLEYKQEINKKINLSYANIGKIEHLCLEYNIDIVDKVFEDGVMFKIKSTKKNLEDFLKKADRLIST